MSTPDELAAEILRVVDGKRFAIEMFIDAVRLFFVKHPRLTSGSCPDVHSVKSRLKDPAHLLDKIRRKLKDGRDINPDNVFQEITDLAGVRVLHLHLEQFGSIHTAISEHVSDGEWVYHEAPKAYTWDPESKEYFESFGLSVEVKESFYTSIHYVVRPRLDAPAACEIQVRTLFEEIWGETDHALNYPHATTSVANREQLRVLARLVSTGSRLGTSIFRVHAIERRADLSRVIPRAIE